MQGYLEGVAHGLDVALQAVERKRRHDGQLLGPGRKTAREDVQLGRVHPLHLLGVWHARKEDCSWVFIKYAL